MTDKRKSDDLTEEELAETNGEPLPDREQMSVIRPEPWPGPVIPIDDPPPSLETEPLESA